MSSYDHKHERERRARAFKGPIFCEHANENPHVLGLDLRVWPEPSQAESNVPRRFGHVRERTNWRSRHRAALKRS